MKFKKNFTRKAAMKRNVDWFLKGLSKYSLYKQISFFGRTGGILSKVTAV